MLTSQGEYLSCISKRGAAVPNEKAVTSCGAKFLIKLNSSIAVTGALMVGTLASRDDLDKVTTPIAPDPEPAPVKPVTPATLIGPMTPATPRPLP